MTVWLSYSITISRSNKTMTIMVKKKRLNNKIRASEKHHHLDTVPPRENSKTTMIRLYLLSL